MEDRSLAFVALQGDSKQTLFGVFDGHGSAKAAEFAAQQLEKNIVDEVVRRRDVSKVKEAVKERCGVAEAVTSDHRPSREDERNRIETSSGYVDLCRGAWRIQCCLAVSKGIGDQHLKQWVIPEPETKIIGIKPECEFLILASDGLWDKVSNQEAVDIARPSCLGSSRVLVKSLLIFRFHEAHPMILA
ncbi:hypothetical protein V6N13_019850 [Hibiscus sabdariffa]|uniref:protein-serine/threonine phosphatase n=1 Tax=Hibiscus sabdariffa TaxID=183260 RepID=A0ABR2ERK9_9ROSI